MEKMYGIYTKSIGKNVSSFICVSKTAKASEDYLNKLFANCEFVKYSDMNSDCIVKIRDLAGCITNGVSNDYLMQLTVLQIRATTTINNSIDIRSLLANGHTSILVISDNKIVTRIFVDELIDDDNGCFIA